MAGAKPLEVWTWSPARVEALEKAIENGWSAGQFERQTGGHCSRNAAIGKARRMGLAFRGNDAGGDNLHRMRWARERRSPPAPPPPRARPAKPPLVAKAPPRERSNLGPPPLPKLRVVQTEGRFVGLLERRDFGECKYVVNDPPAGEGHLSVYCAAKSGDEAYCPAHRAICFVSIAKGQRAFDAAAKLVGRG